MYIEFEENGFSGEDFYEWLLHADSGIYKVSDGETEDLCMVSMGHDGYLFHSTNGLISGSMWSSNIYNGKSKLKDYIFFPVRSISNN